MKKVILCSILILLNFSPLAKSGEHVGNGGGLSESNFAFSRINLKSLLDTCLASSLCLNTNEEKDLAKRVANIASEELKTKNQLVYLSGKKNPTFFFLDDNIRVARTGHKIGDKIFINRDLIYDSEGQALGLPQTTAIIFHEIAHHLGEEDHDFLDLVGAKLGLFLSKKSSTIGTLYGDVTLPITKNKLLELKVIKSAPGKELLTLITQKKNIDLTEVILKGIKNRVNKGCQNESFKCSLFLGLDSNQTYNPQVLYFQSANFNKVISPLIDKKQTWYDVSLTGYSHHDLSRSSSSYYHLPHKIVIRVKLNNLNNSTIDVEFMGIAFEDFFSIKL
jgi:hypothetical protein